MPIDARLIAVAQLVERALLETFEVIESGHDNDNLLGVVVDIQQQFIAAPHSQRAFEQALRCLIDRSQSEFGILKEIGPNDAGTASLRICAAAEIATERFRSVSAGKALGSTPPYSELESSLVPLLKAGKPIVSGSPTSDRKRPRVGSDTSKITNSLGLPLCDGSGLLVGYVGVANCDNGYDEQMIGDCQPLCRALGLMLMAAQRERARSASEAALSASESRLRIFADHVTDGLFLQNAAAEVVDVNRRACESLGYTRDELIGMSPASFDTVITSDEIKAYSARLAAGESLAFDSRHRRKDGREFPVEIRVSPVWINGKLHTLALVCDITERKQSEERLRESEERLELALVASRMGVWEWDIETNNVYWSPECYDIYGDKEFDGRAETFNRLIHPDDIPHLSDVIGKAMQEGMFANWEYRVTPPGGKTRWIANYGFVRRDASGKAIKLLGTARDITEQKLADDALRQSTLLLENVVENIPLAVFVKDPQDDFRIRLWNKAAESIFAIPRQDMIGRTAYDFWPKAQADSYREVDEQVMDEGRMQVVFEESSNPRGGEAIYVHSRKLPLFDRTGKPTLLLAICEDITARKRSEEALRSAQQRLAFTLHGADVGLWDWDLVTNEVNFSAEWKGQLGYSVDEIQNHNLEWESRVHPDDLAEALANVENSVHKRTQEYRSEFRMRHKDGTWRWILSRGSLIDDAQGKPARLMGIHIDITDRKRAEEALQASESRYRCFVDNATDALFLQDRDARIVDVNEQACVSLGYRRDELIGKLPHEFDPDVTPQSVEQTKRRLDAGETIAFDSVHKRKDGSTFPVEVRLRPFWVNNERFHIGLVHDITERKRTEQALRESESRLRTLLENLDKVAVQAYDPDGTITFWNRASEVFYGYSAQQALGQDLVEMLHAEPTREQERRIMAEAIRTGKPPGAEEVEVVRKDGSKMTVFASRVVHPRTGKAPEFFCFDVDITDRKRAEEQLALRQVELLHASRLSTVGQMVAEISHEVAQPLNAIGNFAAASEKILQGGADGQLSTLNEYVRAILDQNERCVTILGRIRDFSRRAPATHDKCDLAQLLYDSFHIMSFELRRNHVRVEFDVPADLPAVCGDRIQLQQLVVNLLTNARDALLERHQDRRTIEIRAAAEPEAIVFEVEDAGCGLSADATIHLFDPFFTTKRHGMGIGLSICQTIVKEHGGRIDALSNPHGGATFRVRLPLSRKKSHV